MNPVKSTRNGEPCISVIVPVYNAGAYLASCLSSIQAQTFGDWECICVDDGSSDDSPDIVARFAAADSRFHLIRQENAGPGIARNAGLKSARGQYFTFLDADDLAHRKMLENLWSLAQKYEADLVVCGNFRFESDEEFHRCMDDPGLLADDVEVERAPLLAQMVDWRKFRTCTAGKFYLRTHHEQLRFPDLFGAEDVYASIDTYARSTCAVFSPSRLYGYRIVEEGLTRSVSRYRNYISGDARVAVHCHSVFREHGVSEGPTAEVVMVSVMRIFLQLLEMSVDPRLTKAEKKSLMDLAREGLGDIRRCVAGEYRVLPAVHCIPYCAIHLRALWILTLWQHVRSHLFRS